ncbi:hypothetical protein Taro_045559, partial [Colocasia esculenta]|nr:hypothetical protein [Colocasia esculenta]
GLCFPPPGSGGLQLCIALDRHLTPAQHTHTRLSSISPANHLTSPHIKSADPRLLQPAASSSRAHTIHSPSLACIAPGPSTFFPPTHIHSPASNQLVRLSSKPPLHTGDPHPTALPKLQPPGRLQLQELPGASSHSTATAPRSGLIE